MRWLSILFRLVSPDHQKIISSQGMLSSGDPGSISAIVHIDFPPPTFHQHAHAQTIKIHARNQADSPALRISSIHAGEMHIMIDKDSPD